MPSAIEVHTSTDGDRPKTCCPKYIPGVFFVADLFIYLIVCLFMQSFIHSVSQTVICMFVYMFIYLFVCWFICLFIYLFVYSFVCLYIYLFIYLFVHSFFMFFFVSHPVHHQLRPSFLSPCHSFTLLEPQSRFGDKPLNFQVVCPQNGTAVLNGLTGDLNK